MGGSGWGALRLIDADADADADASMRYALPKTLQHVCVARNGHDLLRRYRSRGASAGADGDVAAPDEDMGAEGSDDAAAAAAEAGRHYASWIARAHAAVRPKGVVLAFIDDERVAPELLAGLRSRGFRAGALTASLPPDRKARQALLRKARSGRVAVLVVTEMAARGIDISSVALVVNLRVPASSVQYLHRAGRAARLRGQPQRRGSAAAAATVLGLEGHADATDANDATDATDANAAAAGGGSGGLMDADALDSDEYADAVWDEADERGGGAPQAQHGMVLTFVDKSARPAMEAHFEDLGVGSESVQWL